MAPKNKKKNSFYFFMKEMQEREAARGRRISMMDLPNIAHPIWTRMTVAEREPYEELARQHKNDPTLRGGKLASDGTLVEDNLRELQEKERRKTQMIQAIKSYINVDSLTRSQFKEFAERKLFYFISFNLLCKTENTYIPNEIAIVEYSILNGIHNEYCKLIYPGSIPTGYTGEAKRLFEVHEIDIYGVETGCVKNMKQIYDEIIKFINPDDLGELPPLFSLDDQIELNMGCLDTICYYAREKNYFEVWNAVYLLQELRTGVDAEITSSIIASDLLTKSSFNYHSAARCSFHEEKDNHNCALAYSKRLCYLLSDAVCKQFDVIPTENHMPTIALEEKAYTVIEASGVGRTLNHRFKPQPRLDSRSSYYANTETEEDSYSDIQSVTSNTVDSRQPTSTCLAAQMRSMRLNPISSATVPGHGIGRGKRP